MCNATQMWIRKISKCFIKKHVSNQFKFICSKENFNCFNCSKEIETSITYNKTGTCYTIFVVIFEFTEEDYIRNYYKGFFVVNLCNLLKFSMKVFYIQTFNSVATFNYKTKYN